jgi:hypothetical protein
MELTETKNPIAKTDNLVIQELGNETLVYDLDSNKAYNLNETSSFVWQNCDGKKGIADLAFALQKKANQPIKQEVVWFALNELKKEGLVSFETETPQELTGLSRREVIKKIGLGSMIALPLITSLVAPTAAMAQSGSSGNPGEVDSCDETAQGRDLNKTPNDGACKGNGNCCSNNCCATAGGADGICRPATTVC